MNAVPGTEPDWKNGGSAWESNPPAGLFIRHTGFEVRESHQSPFHFRSVVIFNIDWPKKQLLLISPVTPNDRQTDRKGDPLFIQWNVNN